MGYWYYLVYLPILFAARSEGNNDGCTAIKCDVHCYGISQKELLLSVEFENVDGDIELPYSSLTIVDSNFRHIEEFPMLSDCTTAGSKSLTIRNSGIMKIEPKVLKSWFSLDTLDLSYNEIQNTSFLTPLKRVRNLDLSHNRIKYFDMKTFAMSYYIEKIDFSFNEILNFLSNYQISAISLNMSHNHLTELRDLFLNIGGLEILDISYNQLREISMKNFPSVLYLKYLNIGHNKLISIDSEFFELLGYRYSTDSDIYKGFIFSNNELTKVNVSLYDSYEISVVIDSLDYSNNEMKSMNFMKSRYENTEIRSLTLRNNKISDLGGFNFTDTRINVLDLSNNNITYIALKSFVNIRQSLDLSNNKISYINSSHFTKRMFLSKLNLSHNEIEKLNSSTFRPLHSLEELDLSNCLLKQLDEASFSNLSHLKSLNLSLNFIESLPEKLFANLNLNYLDLSRNFLTLLPGNIFSGLNLKLIDLGFNQFQKFFETDFNNSSIRNLIARNNPIIELNEKSFFGLKYLLSIDLSDAGIKELHSDTFEKLRILNYIRLDDNEIQSLPVGLFRNQKNLTTLSVTGNNLTNLNPDTLSELLQLRTLNITLKGNLTQGMFRNLSNLYELNLVKSEITTVKNGSFSGLDMLEKLNFENLKPVKIEVGAFTGLSSLKIFNPRNWFETLQSVKENQFKGLEEVERLDLSHFGVNTVENNAFFGLISLESLNLTGNNIYSLPINGFNGLKTLSSLDLSHNALATPGIGVFGHLINLINLHLSHNKINALTAGMFTNLKKLKFLNLSNNNLRVLESFNLFPLEKLEILDVNFNQIDSIDYTFNDVPSMKTIGIGSNKLQCYKLIVLLRNFRLKNICYEKISYLTASEKNINEIRCI